MTKQTTQVVVQDEGAKRSVRLDGELDAYVAKVAREKAEGNMSMAIRWIIRDSMERAA